MRTKRGMCLHPLLRKAQLSIVASTHRWCWSLPGGRQGLDHCRGQISLRCAERLGVEGAIWGVRRDGLRLVDNEGSGSAQRWRCGKISTHRDLDWWCLLPAKAESEFSVCGTVCVLHTILVCLKAKSTGASEQARQRGQFPTSNLLAKKKRNNAL
jgi:hypothetical protein